MRDEDLYYDFERDAWFERPGIQAFWPDRELAAPSVLPKPGEWYGKPEQPRFRRPGVVLATTLVGATAFAMLVGPATFTALGLLATIAVVATTQRASNPRLLENPDDLDVCLVRVEIVRDGRIVGIDHGAAWFEAGRLMFSGEATSFAIGGEDVLPRSRWRRRQRERWHLLLLRVPSGRASINLVPESSRNARDEHVRRFYTRFHAFRDRPPVARGPRQWPPLQ